MQLFMRPRLLLGLEPMHGTQQKNFQLEHLRPIFNSKKSYR
jgi:hypothetical protein